MENIQTGIIEIEGNRYMRDARGALVPLSTIKAQDQLQDELVRQLLADAKILSNQIDTFYNKCHENIDALLAVLAQNYNAIIGGKKGNLSLRQFDDCGKIQVQIGDFVTFGPELQIAKSIIDEILLGWGADVRPELRALINNVFNVDKEGQINKAELFKLRKIEVQDPRWKTAMEAIEDSIKVVGTKRYFRFYTRENTNDQYCSITIDIAAVAPHKKVQS